MSRPVVEFWFEFASTYSYLSVMRIERAAQAAGVDIAWKPFLLGPVFLLGGDEDHVQAGARRVGVGGAGVGEPARVLGHRVGLRGRLLRGQERRQGARREEGSVHHSGIRLRV